MRNKTKISLLLITILLLTPNILAEKELRSIGISLNPYYTQSLNANTNYDFNFQINPPDGYNQTTSAIVKFLNYMTPTITYNLTINGQTCSPPTHTISTTYSNSEQALISFDCSNIINHEGNYTARLRTNKNTGSLTSWLELTYINQPKSEMKIFGTEYQIGDKATIFLQIQDEQGLPEPNADCHLDVFYPESYNITHPYLLEDAPMIFNNNDDGIYYYDTTTPPYEGVYMISAKCSYTYQNTYVYATDGSENNSANRTPNLGNYTGDTIALNQYDDAQYTKCEAVNTNGTTNLAYNLYQHTPVETNITGFSKYDDNNASALVVVDWTGKYYYINGTPNGYKNGMTITLDIRGENGAYDLHALNGSVYATTPIVPNDGIFHTYTLILSNITNSTNTLYLSDNARAGGLNTYIDYIRIDGSEKTCQATYEFDATIHNPISDLQNITDMDLLHMGEATTIATQSFQYYNWTSATWVTLPNTHIYSGSASSTTPTGINDFGSNHLPSEALNNNTGKILIITNTTDDAQFTLFDNWLNIKLQTGEGIIQEIKGSSELHVTNHSFQIMGQQYQQYLNLTDFLNQINVSLANVTNITQTNQNWLIQLWNYITSYLTNLTSQINQTTTTNQELLLIILNQTNQTPLPTIIEYEESNCITGGNWLINALPINQYTEIMSYPYVSCEINTTLWGLANMTYNPPFFTYTETCPSPQSWNWTITCENT